MIRPGEGVFCGETVLPVFRYALVGYVADEFLVQLDRRENSKFFYKRSEFNDYNFIHMFNVQRQDYTWATSFLILY
jgi:hypothetical protein